MLINAQSKIALTTGLALFAMFFGAGNLIFPLAIGAHSGTHLLAGWAGFMIAGVGLPFLGLFAISLYGGNYWKFFNVLGKYLSFAVVTFIILIIGPLFASPRTEDITYSTLQPFLPHAISNPIFSIMYFALILLLSFKHTMVVDIIGRFISPVKLIAFITLIIASLVSASALLPEQVSATHVIDHSLSVGYGTMDLLAAFFFCHVAYKNTVRKCAKLGITDQKSLMKVTLKACLIGAFLIGFIYTGFMLSAATHAAALHGVDTPALINRLSHIVLGSFGSLFVCLCVTLACIATATALAVVSSNFFYKTIFRRKLPHLACLILVLAVMYMMSILGFDKIMAIATPILNILYPCLIVLCVVNIARKLRKPAFKPTTIRPLDAT
jgi:LIVCS family branched-chain amino acid:cation transporter